jgi:hypothetical protein
MQMPFCLCSDFELKLVIAILFMRSLAQSGSSDSHMVSRQQHMKLFKTTCKMLTAAAVRQTDVLTS